MELDWIDKNWISLSRSPCAVGWCVDVLWISILHLFILPSLTSILSCPSIHTYPPTDLQNQIKQAWSRSQFNKKLIPKGGKRGHKGGIPYVINLGRCIATDWHSLELFVYRSWLMLWWSLISRSRITLISSVWFWYRLIQSTVFYCYTSPKWNGTV